MTEICNRLTFNDHKLWAIGCGEPLRNVTVNQGLGDSRHGNPFVNVQNGEDINLVYLFRYTNDMKNLDLKK